MSHFLTNRRVLLSSFIVVLLFLSTIGTFFLHVHPYTAPAKDDFGCLFYSFEHGVFSCSLTLPPLIPQVQFLATPLLLANESVALNGDTGSPPCRSPPPYLT